MKRMPNKVVHYKSIGPVTFFRNRLSKSMKISVKPDKSVLVSFPMFVSLKEATTFLSKHEDWILKQQEKAAAARKLYPHGLSIPTKLHLIELCQGKIGEIITKGNILQLYAEDFNSEAGHLFLEDILNQVYRSEARKLLPARLKELAATHGFSYAKVTIRNNRRNWGSCSSRNNISLNLQMMKLPDELIDYILLHELVHTEIKDHSERFWKRLDQLTYSRAKKLAKEVKKYTTYTI
jgi:predicted metal-dependent hydrolase